MGKFIVFDNCPCDGCQAKPCGHPAKCVQFALWLNKNIDAVEVIRCSDCQNSEPCKARGQVWCPKIGRYMKEDGFCSEGKGKDNG